MPYIDLIELFKTPAISAVIAAITAICSAPLTQRLSRKATERQWLREQRSHAYADLLSSLDYLSNTHVRMSQLCENRTSEDVQDFKTASEQFRRARSVADLYAPAEVSAFLDNADSVSICTAGTENWHLATAAVLGNIRKQIIEIARRQLGSKA